MFIEVDVRAAPVKGGSQSPLFTAGRGARSVISKGRPASGFQREHVPTGQEVCQKQLYALIDKIENVEVDEAQIEPFLPEIYDKLQWLDREQLIKHFVSAEFNRFLSYYKGARDLNVAERKDQG